MIKLFSSLSEQIIIDVSFINAKQQGSYIKAMKAKFIVLNFYQNRKEEKYLKGIGYSFKT